VRQVDPAYHNLGYVLLAQEAGARKGSDAMIDAAEVVIQKLRVRTIMVFGREGFYSLLVRALHLAKARQPLLKAVEIEPLHNRAKDEARLKGLREALAGSDADSVSKALVTLIGSFVWLLATFIGPDLALRELQRTWPALSFPQAGPDSEEAKQ
jgi:hypothetical protein